MSSPQKSQTPTLNSLLMKPTTGQQNCYGNGGNGAAGQEPNPGVYPTTADGYWAQNQRYSNVKGQPLANNFPSSVDGDSTNSFKQMPPGGFGPGSYPPQRNPYPASSSQGNAPIYNLQQPYAPQGNYVGQQSGSTTRTTNYGADQESMPNGAPSSVKININSTSISQFSSSTQDGQRFQPGPPAINATPKHPTVASLKQEYPGSSPGSGRSSSPASNCTGGAPNSPASHMRHSPVSPTPVSVYQTGCYPNQSQSMVHPFSHAQPFGGAPPHSIFNENNSNYSIQTTSNSYPNTYPGFQSGVYSNGPNAQSPLSQQASRFRSPLQGPPGPMGSTLNGPFSGPLNDSYRPPAHQFYNSPGRPPMSVRTSNGPTNFNNERLDSPAIGDGTDTRDSIHSGNGTPIGDRPRTSTPASGRTKMNGSKESHPSTPAPASPGGASSIHDDMDSNLSSPSWHGTPMSPAIGRQASINSSMGPPAPVLHSTLSSSSSVSSSSGAPLSAGPPPSMPPTHKESGLSLVQRLLGDVNQNQYSIQEWEDRRRFYERLVHFCETKGHPLTGQPTVSKQTVDLFRLYMTVKQSGGFEQVTRNKGWKELCQVASLPYTSGASYQLRKHYIRYLLPCECYFDRNQIEPSVLLQSIESKRKSKQPKNASQQQNFLSSPNSSSMGGDIDPGPVLTACESKKKGKGKSAASLAAQQPYPESIMGPPSGKFGPPMDNHGTPPNPNVPYLSTNPNYPPSSNHLIASAPSGQQLMSANEMVTNPFDDRSSAHQQSLQQQQYTALGQRPQYGGYPTHGGPTPPAKFPPDRNVYDAYSTSPAVNFSSAHPNQSGQQQINLANRGGATITSYPTQNSYPPPSAMNSGGPLPPGYESTSSVPPPNQYAMPPGDVRRNAPSSDPQPYSIPTSSSHQTSHSSFRSQDPFVSQNAAAASFYQQPPANHIQSLDGAPSNVAPKGHQSSEAIGQQYYSNAKPPPWIQQQSRYGGAQPPNHLLNAPNLPGNVAKDARLYGSTTYSQGYPPAPFVHVREVSMKSYPSAGPSTSHRKEISPVSTFPHHSVEATLPFVKRRRKLYCRDIGKVDPWRVVMALKSGLAFETTWALNVLNVLLYDDSTVTYFGLSTLPGLLDSLIELFRRTLAEILSDFEFDAKDDEVTYESCVTKDESSIEFVVDSLNLSEETSEDMSKKPKLKSFFTETSTNNFTMSTIKGRRVRFVSPKTPLLTEPPNLYEMRPLHEYEGEFWQLGGSNSTEHLSSKFDESSEDALKQKFFRSVVENSPPSSSKGWKRKKSFDDSLCSCDPSTSCNEKKQLKRSADDDDRSTTSQNDKCRQAPSFFYSSTGPKNDCDEVFTHNTPPVNVILEFRTVAINRCVSLSNVLRGLSFLPGNDLIMAKHAALIRTVGSLLLLGHRHVDRRRTPCKPSTVEDIEALNVETSSTANNDEKEKLTPSDVDDVDMSWFYDDVLTLIDDAFVILCNLSANLDLYNHPENVSRPLINALLHWAVCRAPVSQDPLRNWASVAPGRYALEILCKLSVLECNVDLILATPSWSRLEMLIDQLVNYLCVNPVVDARSEEFQKDLILREFAVVLLHTFCCACPITCVVAALETYAVQNLISFLEAADAEMHRVVQYQGMQALRDNPEMIGTSVGMLRRAAGALLAMTKNPACHVKFYRHQMRLLNFTMSHLMDSRVGATIAEALYEIQKESQKLAADSSSNVDQEQATNQTEPVADDTQRPTIVDEEASSAMEHVDDNDESATVADVTLEENVDIAMTDQADDVSVPDNIDNASIADKIDDILIADKTDDILIADKVDDVSTTEKTDEVSITEKIDDVSTPEKIDNFSIADKIDDVSTSQKNEDDSTTATTTTD